MAASFGRRSLLRGVGAATLGVPFGAGLGGCANSSAEDEPKGNDVERFVHGIASGDPLHDGVVLWTRVSIDSPSNGPIHVDWELAENPAMTEPVMSGTAQTDADRDFTVKVDARGLKPATTYYYRFRALGGTSKIGRTRTTAEGANERLRLAVVSCASYAHGYFHGYRALSQLADLDAVIHLGDYIYEGGTGDYGNVREYEPPHEIVTLEDYRARHALYKRDADLQEVHRQQVFITVWDDHELANNAYKDGAENHTPGREGDFGARKAAARRAYMEWMPIREQEPEEKIFRRFAFGDLVDLLMLDTRLYARTKQPGGVVGPAPSPDPTRTLLGDEQASWLEEHLKGSAAHWKLLGQQVMVGNIVLRTAKRDASGNVTATAELANLDQWQGYPESRNRFLTFLRDSGVKNVVILTGDIHSSWANEIVFDPNDRATYEPATGKGSLAVEFVTPAITSPGIPEVFVGLIESARSINSHVRYIEPSHRGFVILDITRERVQGAWHLFDDIASPELAIPKFSAAWSVKNGETRLNANAQAAPTTGGAAPAP